MSTVDFGSLLRRLKLSGLLETLDLRVAEGMNSGLSYREFLEQLLTDELNRRDSRRLGLRIQKAGFEAPKPIEDFDFSFNPKLPRTTIIELATCAFVAAHQNALLIGPAGVGKSHLAQAVGLRACKLDKTVLFLDAAECFRRLRAARADASYDKLLASYCRVDLLILDDLGLKPLRDHEPEDLYELIRRRYQRGSLLITSNRAVEELPPLFGNPLLASAALDRLLHDAHLVELVGDSYRNPPDGRPRRRIASKAAA